MQTQTAERRAVTEYYEKGYSVAKAAQRAQLPAGTVSMYLRAKTRSLSEAQRLRLNHDLYAEGRVRATRIYRASQLRYVERLDRSAIAAILQITPRCVTDLLQTPYAKALKQFAYGPGGTIDDKRKHCLAMAEQGIARERIAKTLDVSIRQIEIWREEGGAS